MNVEKQVKKYVNRKKRRRRAAIIASICSVGVLILVIIALNLFFVDRFTITTNKDPALCLTLDKEQYTTELHAPPLLKATDTQFSDIPETIDENTGSKNTNYYFAYSFYLGAESDAPSVNYELSMTLDKASQALEDAMRVMIIKNNERTVYAQRNKNGNPEPIYYGEDHTSEPTIIGYTIPFKDNKHIILEPYCIVPGEFDKYTIVMWVDGWESNNSMQGGTFQANLKFSTISINN